MSHIDTTSPRNSADLPIVPADTVGMDAVRLKRIDEVVEAAIQARQVPGSVVLVGRGDYLVHGKAYGHRSLVPEREATTIDTIYDCASLTKPVATASAVLRLAEQGRLRLAQPVAELLPEWDTSGARGDVRVAHLLTHTSGFEPFERYHLRWSMDEARPQILRDLCTRPLAAAPGEVFTYTDLGFILLGEIVERVAGTSLAEFCRTEIFKPLQMHDTSYCPADNTRHRIAPTEWRAEGYVRTRSTGDGPEPAACPVPTILRGQVHDGNAAVLGGVSGHAGLFSTASDLARFCRMLLRGGELDGTRIFSPVTVHALSTDQARLTSSERRGYGWDINTAYAVQRGDLFRSGFGHTGWTGCSLWIAPEHDLFIVIMSNRVHPDGTGNAGPLRAAIANVVAGSLR